MFEHNNFMKLYSTRVQSCHSHKLSYTKIDWRCKPSLIWERWC